VIYYLYFTVPRAPVGIRKRKREFSAKAAKSKWDELEKCVSVNLFSVVVF